MDRWHRKTMLMTGSGALRSNLKALNQSLSAQVQRPAPCCVATQALATRSAEESRHSLCYQQAPHRNAATALPSRSQPAWGWTS